jgi:hypothetical protein
MYNLDGYILSLYFPFLTSSARYNHTPNPVYKKKAATAPTPATNPPTLAWLAAPVNSDGGAL